MISSSVIFTDSLLLEIIKVGTEVTLIFSQIMKDLFFLTWFQLEYKVHSGCLKKTESEDIPYQYHHTLLDFFVFMV
ncbi:MAG: hypothetical protein ACXAES_18720 [Promethearchaeota archaeon]